MPDFLVSPKNQAVIAGEPVQFNCEPQEGDPSGFQWNQDSTPLSSGPNIFPPYKDSFALLVDGRIYNLFINSTSSSKASQYGCNNPYPERTQIAQLLVLGKHACHLLYTIPPTLYLIQNGLNFALFHLYLFV